MYRNTSHLYPVLQHFQFVLLQEKKSLCCQPVSHPTSQPVMLLNSQVPVTPQVRSTAINQEVIQSVSHLASQPVSQSFSHSVSHSDRYPPSQSIN
jgi:hypothetical protein